ncbi:MAG: enoyl-CoA hydratase-related protein, partial [Myxococcota bacterium]|nr:enoyl-CoA hydratase-related protein [Myxococcota bacterium]
MMAEATCLYVVSDGIATITLNRPEARNALSATLIAELARAFEAAREDAEVRVVILTGAGDAFCAGLDLRELGGGSGIGEESEWDQPSYAIAMRAFDGPIIGAINGA